MASVAAACQTVGSERFGRIPASAVFAPGDYKVRIQATGDPNGAYAYAQTTVLSLVVPAATPAPTPTPTPLTT
jgi:hypothetical protein